MIIGHITDFHIAEPGDPFDVRYAPAQYLERAVAHILALAKRPDVILATGDLTETATAGAYTRLRELLTPLEVPVYLLPGNHDDRDNLRAAFPDHAYLPEEGFIQYVIEDYPVRLVALDTVIAGEIGGELCAERLAWLEACLAEAPERPTLILMHHPPFITGIEGMDRNRDQMGLIGADALGAVIARHPQVERIVCGHLHRPIESRWYGTLARTASSTVHQFALNLAAGGLTRVLEPAAVDLHVWLPGQGLVSHTSYIGDFPLADRSAERGES